MNDLKHYGILGMRWGRRKGGERVTVGRGVRGAVKEVGGLIKDAVKDDISRVRSIAKALTPKPRNVSEDHKLAQTLKKKHVSELSNDDIRKITTRLQLEKQLRDISAAERQKGRTYLKGILGSKLGQTLVASLIKRAFSRGVPGDTSPKPPNTYVTLTRED